ncbi:HAD family hydrolase [Gracilibacillus kekensis]|uniref:Putative hydrolase of the HAD superfamily n=1 Tax=Gracilibacillus kekensis TaxID=1027249 RepID=A0A1M7P2M2_9BACI|nr:HAD family hydrolase [Gracilibacillus kekensis]SHN10703.1 putative hydrolase of the HAD superfamily [Gracilibacillus kekensis]
MNTIIFDVDDTLYDQALSFHQTFRKLVKENSTYQELDAIYRASRKYSERLFDQSEKGEITTFEWQTGRFIKALNDFNISISSETASDFNDVYKQQQGRITLFPEIKELLSILKQKGTQLAILTNGEEQHQTMKIKQLELHKWIPEENIFISGSHGIAKPNKEIFDIVTDKLKCDPVETVYIGDSFEKDIIGAKQAGWQAIWMNHRNRKIPKESTVFPDLELQHAREILSYFEDNKY